MSRRHEALGPHQPVLHILGGGPAGLAAAHYARKRGLPARVYEAGPETGGNCRTLRHGDFLFDTGAHRIHAKDPGVTREIRSLLGAELLIVDAPSRISHGGRLLRFPLSPRDLIGRLSPLLLLRIARETLARKARPGPFAHFEDLAVAQYGKTLAGLFLLNYTRKLWGRAPENLSPAVAGGRLAGLDAKTFLLAKLLRRARHLDGAFLYPRRGIGALFRAVEAGLPEDGVRTGARVTRIRHDGTCILGITVNGVEEISTERVVSTLPLPAFLRALDPPPPPDILSLAGGIAFRNLVLCVVFLDQERFSENASLYFPDPAVPFTRLYEPRNRSPFMAPAGKTCIVLEIPCDPQDAVWTEPDESLVARLLPHLAIRGAGTPRVIGSEVHRVSHAYPILERGIETRVSLLLDYCSRFSNLRLTGRNAVFRYAHIHDMFRAGAEAVGN
jgi:protoporphyrinogen oxidase